MSLECIELNPSEAAAASIIVLHGLGADGHDFVPVAREHYYFAVREAMLRSAPIVALRHSLTGPIFKELVSHMTGYDATHSGELERVDGSHPRSPMTSNMRRKGT